MDVRKRLTGAAPAERSRDLLRRFRQPRPARRADGNLESSTAALDAPPPAHIRRQAAGSQIDIHGSQSGLTGGGDL